MEPSVGRERKMGKTENIAGFRNIIAVRITGNVAIEKYEEKRPLGRHESRQRWKRINVKYIALILLARWIDCVIC